VLAFAPDGDARDVEREPGLQREAPAREMHGVAGARLDQSRLQLLLGGRAWPDIPGARFRARRGHDGESGECERREGEPHAVLPPRAERAGAWRLATSVGPAL